MLSFVFMFFLACTSKVDNDSAADVDSGVDSADAAE